MTSSPRAIIAAAVVVTAGAGCGGSSIPAGGGLQLPATPRPDRTSQPGGRGSLPYGIRLPVSSHGPTTCTVYENNYGTQIVVDSQTLDVRAQCFLWTVNRAGVGYLWGYERAATLPAGARLCSLTDRDQKLTASVIDVASLVPGSAVQRARGLSVCGEILASGWRRAPVSRARSTRS